MSQPFARGKIAISTCDRCGQVFLLKELKKLTIKLKLTNIKVCQSCWEPDQPQWQTGMFPITDPQALREPRPDQSLNQIRAILTVINQGVAGGTQLGVVTINTP